MSKRFRILIVDDDPAWRTLLAYCVEELPQLALAGSVGDGLTGLELMRALSPDLVLLDLVLPAMSGLEALDRYRAGGGEGKVLVTSAVTGRETVGAALAAGADFYLMKPALLDEVMSTVLRLCRREDRAERLLREMGVGRRTLGVKYTAQCARLLSSGAAVILKEAYWQVAAEFHTDDRCVEKNVRGLIAAAHALATPAYQQVTGRSGEGKPPSNGVFLTDLARQLAAATFPL